MRQGREESPQECVSDGPPCGRHCMVSLERWARMKPESSHQGHRNLGCISTDSLSTPCWWLSYLLKALHLPLSPIFLNPKAERFKCSPLPRPQVTTPRASWSQGHRQAVSSGHCDQCLHCSGHPNLTLKSDVWVFTLPPVTLKPNGLTRNPRSRGPSGNLSHSYT